MIHISAYTYPNHSGVGAIDSPDRFEHVFDPYCTREVLEKIFMRDILMIRPQKLGSFDVFKAFVSNFLYYDIY